MLYYFFQRFNLTARRPEKVGIQEYSNAITRLDSALEELKSSRLNTFFKVIDKAVSMLDFSKHIY